MQVVLFGDHRDQLIAEHESDDHPGNGDDDRLGEGTDHAKDVAVPTLRGLPDLLSDRSRLLVDIGKHGRQVAFDQADEEVADRLFDFVQQTSHQGLSEQACQQRDQLDPDQDDTASGHQLFDALALRTGIIVAISLEQVDHPPDREACPQGDD